MSDVVIIGAGPYGLSLAAHLRARGVGHRIFGRVMENWRSKMPQGMLLKSDGFASNLEDPASACTLKEFSRQHGLRYADEGIPVPIANFIAYGEAFQKQHVPHLDPRLIVGLERGSSRFVLRLEDGEMIEALHVVLAIGVSDFPYMPPALAGLGDEFVTHASQHGPMGAFAGREVAVLGGGSSATDIAALLHEAGASVRMVTRQADLRFHSLTEDRGSLANLVTQLRTPRTGIGPGWRHVFYTRAPHLFWHLPEDRRFRIVKGTLGPAGGWFMRDRVIGRFPILHGLAPQRAEVKGGRVQLHLAGPGAPEQTVAADHVVAATGYKIDVRAIRFLSPELCSHIHVTEQAPVLSRNFETSVPGLYVIGPAAAFSFGPVMRFVYGAKPTIPRIARHLASVAGGDPRPVEGRQDAPAMVAPGEAIRGST